MRHLPVFLDLKGRRAIVVGGGGAAARKAEVLFECGALVEVIAPKGAGDALRAMARDGRATVSERAFIPEDLGAAAIIVVASDDRLLQETVAAAARAAGAPLNVVDAPALSTAIMPAIVDRDPVIVAISSAGAAPVLARQIRARIEAMLPSNLGRLARFAERFRKAVRLHRPDGRSRRRFWERALSGPIAAAVLMGDEHGALERMMIEINRPEFEPPGQGRVLLVGAGPGDPDLLTLKAQRALHEADVIVYDRLVTPEILGAARRDADRVYVGKAKGAQERNQDEINALLLELASTGQTVVRLKGGDPFIFGRGGEEAAFLRAHGVAVEVVPGVTAALGCAAVAGVPLTHRDHAHALTLLTGHGRDGEPDVDWSALAASKHTLAIYMGASRAGQVAARLIEHGLDRETPAAVVANGARDRQRVATGPLADLQLLAEEVGPGPALIIVGEVVRLAPVWGAAAHLLARKVAS